MLRGEALECVRGGRTLFRALDVAVRPGEVVRIVGPNGSGKTSLLRMLCGLLAPAAGRVAWNGEPIDALREEFSRHVLYVGHAAALKDELTAEENLGFACALSGLPPAGSAMDEALGRFGVPRGRPVGRLSQGQRRRAALARLALGAGVSLWCLDEPLVALDAQAAALVAGTLEAHARAGGLVIFTTHQEPGIAVTATVELAGHA